MLPRNTADEGFVEFQEDGSVPTPHPCPGSSRGLACDHAGSDSRLRGAIGIEADVDFIPHARVNAVDDERVAISTSGAERSVTADRIVCAGGRASIVRRTLGLSSGPMLSSRMLEVTTCVAGLPFECFGQVVLGGPGSIPKCRLAYGCARVIFEMPLDAPGQDRFLVGTLHPAAAGDSPAGPCRGAARGAIPRGGQSIEAAGHLWKPAPGAERRCGRTRRSRDGGRHDARARRCADAP